MAQPPMFSQRHVRWFNPNMFMQLWRTNLFDGQIPQFLLVYPPCLIHTCQKSISLVLQFPSGLLLKSLFFMCVCAFFFQIPFSYEIHIHVIDGFNFNHFKPC
jgi:hypothetical protein